MKYKRPKPVYGKKKEIKFTKLEGELPVTEGWNQFKNTIPLSAPPEIFAIIKQAYFTGALSLFGSMLNAVDETVMDETPEELSKMERIQSELDYFKDNQRSFLEDAFTECLNRQTDEKEAAQ